MKLDPQLADAFQRILESRVEVTSSSRDEYLLNKKIILDHFINGTEADRAFIRSKTDARNGESFIFQAQYFAERAVRENDPKLLLHGFASLALEGLNSDPRDFVSMILLLNRSGEKIGVQFEKYVAPLLHLADATTRQFVHDIFHLPRDMRIESVGYRESTGDQGFYYSRQV